VKWANEGPQTKWGMTMQAYSDPSRQDDPGALPDIEVFQLTAREVAEQDEDLIYEYMKRREYRLAAMNSKAREAMFDAMIEDNGITGGWYWWACFPGCLPDGDPAGPFETAKEALADAQNQEG
jgi:hypothetical protein